MFLNNLLLKWNDRRFQWISSSADNKELEVLQRRMDEFYARTDLRALYQRMVDETEGRQVMPNYIVSLKAEKILEIGCASGRTYRQLRDLGFQGKYCGVEIASDLVEKNRLFFPEAEWQASSVYELPYNNDLFDLCFSVYVLEHLVYPERGLREMMRVVKPGGRVVLMFPDFAASGRLGSQMLGLSTLKTAREKALSGRFCDAVISLYDSRIRLPAALRNAAAIYGPFPVNLNPVCLRFKDVMGADVDAVYIASKNEVSGWASASGYRVEYPFGIAGDFAEQAFMTIIKERR